MRPAETLKPRVFVSSGSDGCHLFSSEPEDESASVGACGGIQFSPETQHEETHLNGHVDPCFSPTSFDLTLSDSYANKKKQKVRAHPQPQVLASQNYCLPGFLFKKKKSIYLKHRNICNHTHTHTGRGCIAEVSRRGTSYLLLLGRQTCIYFHSFSYALTLLAFHSFFLFMWGRNAPADVFLHCDWLIKKLLWLNCAPSPHTALHLRSAILLSPHLLLLFFFFFFFQREVMIYLWECWQVGIDWGTLHNRFLSETKIKK